MVFLGKFIVDALVAEAKNRQVTPAHEQRITDWVALAIQLGISAEPAYERSIG